MVLNTPLNSAVFWTFVQKQPPELFNKKGVLRNSTKFTGKRLCQRLAFNNVASLRPATLLIKRIWHRYFPVNFVKFLRTPFFYRTPLVAASVPCRQVLMVALVLAVIFHKQNYVRSSVKILFVITSLVLSES